MLEDHPAEAVNCSRSNMSDKQRQPTTITNTTMAQMGSSSRGPSCTPSELKNNNKGNLKKSQRLSLDPPMMNVAILKSKTIILLLYQMLPTVLSPSLAARLDSGVASDVQEANGRGIKATRTLTRAQVNSKHCPMGNKVRGLKIYANPKLGVDFMKHQPGNHIITIMIR